MGSCESWPGKTVELLIVSAWPGKQKANSARARHRHQQRRRGGKHRQRGKLIRRSGRGRGAGAELGRGRGFPDLVGVCGLLALPGKGGGASAGAAAEHSLHAEAADLLDQRRRHPDDVQQRGRARVRRDETVININHLGGVRPSVLGSLVQAIGARAKMNETIGEREGERERGREEEIFVFVLRAEGKHDGRGGLRGIHIVAKYQLFTCSPLPTFFSTCGIARAGRVERNLALKAYVNAVNQPFTRVQA